jgi:hypothetical protein
MVSVSFYFILLILLQWGSVFYKREKEKKLVKSGPEIAMSAVPS